MPEAAFEILDHTADVAVRGRGPTRMEALRQVALGMFWLLVPPARVRPLRRWSFGAGGEDAELLLFNLCDELLFLHHSEAALAHALHLTMRNPGRPGYRVQGVLEGEPVDPRRHRLGTEIKGATLHAIEVRRADGGWTARAVFDV